MEYKNINTKIMELNLLNLQIPYQKKLDGMGIYGLKYQKKIIVVLILMKKQFGYGE